MSNWLELEGIIATTGPWRKSFAVLPHRTITGHWIWLTRCYMRDISVYTIGSYAEPDTQWARDGFEILLEKVL